MAKKIAVRCPSCGGTRYLRPCDAKRATLCQKCHLRQIAPKGWEATKARYGEKAAVKHVQSYRLAHPSSLERRVMQVLDELQVTYEREAWWETEDGKVFLLDFRLSTGLIIEVDGAWAHQHHQARDAAKVAALRAAGERLLVLSEVEVKNGLRKQLAAVAVS